MFSSYSVYRSAEKPNSKWNKLYSSELWCIRFPRTFLHMDKKWKSFVWVKAIEHTKKLQE